MVNKIFTIGYEDSTLPMLIERLKLAGVKQVLDIRAVASSRRAGFSKTILRNSLEEEGIGYQHLRTLGTPKEGREAAKKGKAVEMEIIFNQHMENPDAQDALAKAAVLVKEQSTALLCYESSVSCCHRRIVADLIQKKTNYKIKHL